MSDGLTDSARDAAYKSNEWRKKHLPQYSRVMHERSAQRKAL